MNDFVLSYLPYYLIEAMYKKLDLIILGEENLANHLI